jgi:hypothetical protein
MGLTQLTPDKLLHADEPTAQLGIQFGAATRRAPLLHRVVQLRPPRRAMHCKESTVDCRPSTVDLAARIPTPAQAPAQPNTCRGGRAPRPAFLDWTTGPVKGPRCRSSNRPITHMCLALGGRPVSWTDARLFQPTATPSLRRPVLRVLGWREAAPAPAGCNTASVFMVWLLLPLLLLLLLLPTTPAPVASLAPSRC